MLKLYSSLFFFLILLAGKLRGDEILVVPSNHIIWDKKTLLPEFQSLSKVVKFRGTSVRLSNLSEFIDPITFQLNLSKVTKIIFCNTPRWVFNWKDIVSRIPKEKMILIMYDSPIGISSMYSTRTQNMFGSILTWNDSLVDNKKYFKFYYPSPVTLSKNLPSFNERKLLTQISNDKKSYNVNELYSARRYVIDFFEQKTEDVFDFYGKHWKKRNFRNYRGNYPDKMLVLKNYRFSFAYEDMFNIKGYVTNKIFDCFCSGTIPIYWGASNVEKFIPKSCYIAKKDFFSLDELYLYVRNMKEDEYERYQMNIRKFLRSGKAQLFTASSFAKNLHRVIYKKNVKAAIY